MTLVHRRVAKEPSSDDRTFHRVERTYAQVASVPVLSIRVPEPIVTHNPYSALNDTLNDSSHSDADSEKYTWNVHDESTSVSAGSDTDDMPPLIDESDEYSDMPPLIDESNVGSESESEESESDSDQEIIVNRRRYQRVRTQCNDIPYPVTCSFTVWAVAMFLQFIFQLCAIGKCSPASLLDCSRRL